MILRSENDFLEASRGFTELNCKDCVLMASRTCTLLALMYNRWYMHHLTIKMFFKLFRYVYIT